MKKEINRKPSIVAIGNFDGFHLGHKKIVNTLLNISKDTHYQSILITFSPNPKEFFKREINFINTDSQKQVILENQKVDKVCFLDFNKYCGVYADDFVRNILVEKFKMKHIVVGTNFRFGKDKKGDLDILHELADLLGFRVTVVEPVYHDDIRVSSSYIRKLLLNSKIPEANKILGRPYSIEGYITEGEKVGKELGFPTINMKTENSLLPEGVYETRVEIDGEVFDSITNIGFCPTFSGEEKKVESHIFKFDRIVYGKFAKIFFQKKIRDEIKFESIENLIEQIKKDINNIIIDKQVFF
jgi:riboflavin kinase/FMN adenylyltransferase